MSVPGGSPAPAAAPAATPAANGAPNPAAAPTNAPAANGPPETTPATPAPWKRSAKVHGKSYTLTDKEVPPELRSRMGEEDAVRLVLGGLSGRLAIDEAAKMRKESQDALESIRNPEKMMDELIRINGGDRARIDAAIERYYLGLAKQAEMSPQDREREQLRAENERFKREKQEREQGEKTQREQAQIAQHRESYKAKFVEAVKAAKLPASPLVMQRMAAHARLVLNATGHDPDPAQVAADVRAELREEWEAIHGSASEDDLAEIFGEERMAKLRKRDVERLKAPQQAARPAPVPRATDGTFAPRSATKAHGERPMSTREFFAKRRG